MEKNVIFIRNNSTDYAFDLKFLSSSMIPMYLFENNGNGLRYFEAHKRYRNFTINELHLRKKNDPITGAVIAASSNATLSLILEGMSNSIWWNHEALFLIINKDLDNGCNIADLFLGTVWAFNILSAIYVCYNLDNHPTLYTFNPYTSLAPKFWNKSEDVHFPNTHWSMFQHSLESSQFFWKMFDESKSISIIQNYSEFSSILIDSVINNNLFSLIFMK